MTDMHHIRRGTGKPLLLIHGLGGAWRSWNPILDDLAAEREVIAVDLPGFGETPPLPGEVSIKTLADAVTAYFPMRGCVGSRSVDIFPQWDAPYETTRLILARTRGDA